MAHFFIFIVISRLQNNLRFPFLEETTTSLEAERGGVTVLRQTELQLGDPERERLLPR